MNFIGYISLLIFIIVSSDIAYSQVYKLIQPIDNYYFRNTLNYNDIYLPRDYYLKHHGRNSFNERLLESPIYSFDIASFYETEIKKLNINSFEPFFGHVFNDLGFAKIEIAELNPMIPRALLNDMLGVNIDSAFGPVGTIIMSRYIANYLACRSILDKGLNSINFNDFIELVNLSDSIIYNPNYDSDNIYEYHNNANITRQISANILNKSYHLDSMRVLSAGISFLIEVIKLNENFKTNFTDAKKHIKTTIIDTKYGRFALGGIGNDTYKGDFALIVDLGGNDVYDIDINSKNDALKYPVRLIVDFDGNDSYKSGSYGLGCGFFGVGFVLDLAGNDSYQTGDFSLGCGIFGLGAIIDYSGDDTYKSRSYSQGSSTIGMGFLIDYDGNDSYTAEHFSQAFAGPKSISFLHDKSGNDKYVIQTKLNTMSFSQAVSLGIDDLWGGGIAFLIDEDGNDIFKSTNATQSFAYGYGIASLINSGTSSSYIANDYSQSVAILNSHSLIIDYSDSCKFISNKYSNYADNFSFSSILIDKYGEFVTVERFNSNYGINVILNNKSARDSITLLFKTEIDQQNWYNNIIASSNTLYYNINSKSHRNPDKSFDLRIPITNLYANKQNFKEPRLSNSSDSLLLIAISNRLTKQMNESAIDRLTNDTTMAYVVFGIILNYDTDIALPILRKFYHELNQPQIIKLLEDSLRSTSKNIVNNSAELLFELNSIKSFDKIAEQYNNVNWLVREKIAQLIGKFNRGSYSVILRMLNDDFHPYVRASAAHSLAFSDPTPDNLINPLNDKYFIVRNSVCLGLIERKKVDFKLYKSIIDKLENNSGIEIMATVFPYIDIKRSDSKLFESFINNAPLPLINRLFYNKYLITDHKHYNLIEKSFSKSNDN